MISMDFSMTLFHFKKIKNLLHSFHWLAVRKSGFEQFRFPRDRNFFNVFPMAEVKKNAEKVFAGKFFKEVRGVVS